MARTDEQFDHLIKSIYDQVGRLIRTAPPLDIEHAALMVIDMQNQFAHPDGGIYLNGSRFIVRRIKRLLDLFRKHDRPVIFTRHEHEPDNSDTGVMDLWWSGNHIHKGTWAAEIIEKLPLAETDLIVSKNRYSAFQNTELQKILAERDVKELVITGVMTNLCCETTARVAFMNDYIVYFCVDGTATATDEMHLASIRNLAYGFAYIVTAEDILRPFV